MAAVVRLGNGEAITRVATDLGYSSPSAFTSVFRRVLGSMGVAMTATGSMMMNVGTVIGWVVLALVLVFALAALICVLLLKSGRREQVLGRALPEGRTGLRQVLGS